MFCRNLAKKQERLPAFAVWRDAASTIRGDREIGWCPAITEITFWKSGRLCQSVYRLDLICFVNGIPLVFFELKAVYINIRTGFDENLSDYSDTIPHAFYHNAFLIVSNG